MVSLDWNKVKQNVVITYTKKKFYNQFLYKLSYNVPAVRLITWAKSIDHLKDKVDVWNSSSSKNVWYHKPFANLAQLEDFYKFYYNKPVSVKFRLEQGTFSIYSNSEQELYDIAVNNLANWSSDISVVSVVESQQVQTLLDQGFTVVKKPPKYAFRVRLREGFINLKERQDLKLYLTNLGKEVKVTDFILNRLDSNTKYFGGGYAYINDSRLISMLKLVAPTVIGPVNQMVNQ